MYVIYMLYILYICYTYAIFIHMHIYTHKCTHIYICYIYYYEIRGIKMLHIFSLL